MIHIDIQKEALLLSIPYKILTHLVDKIEEIHAPRSELELMAEIFRNCFEPNAYELDKHFAWMSESQREELGKQADKDLKQVFLDQVSDISSAD